MYVVYVSFARVELESIVKDNLNVENSYVHVECMFSLIQQSFKYVELSSKHNSLAVLEKMKFIYMKSRNLLEFSSRGINEKEQLTFLPIDDWNDISQNIAKNKTV